MLDPKTLEDHLDDQRSFMKVLAGQAPALQPGGNGIFPRDSADQRVFLAGPRGDVKVLSFDRFLALRSMASVTNPQP